jgi:hypothetical protein
VNRRLLLSLLSLVLCVIAVRGTAASKTGRLSAQPAKSFFNPSVGEALPITISVPTAGRLAVTIVDRDAFPIRHLPPRDVKRGEVKMSWDGHADGGAIVPDEAYSMKVDLDVGGRTTTYFPAAAQPADMLTIPARWYDRRTGILSYELPKPCRVHVQAGSAVIDAKTKKADGPVLKTVANREPRTGGSVIEQWNGLDESGTIYVPDLPNFVMAIAATLLPENAIITVGNRKQTFAEYAARERRGESLVQRQGDGHVHHGGLTALEDIAPRLGIEAVGASWSAADKAWVTRGKKLSMKLTLSGPSSEAFVRQGGSVVLFVDGKRVATEQATAPPMTISLPLEPKAGSPLLVAVNWVTGNGPVAANAIRLVTEQ